MKKLMTITGMFILALGLGACNTMKGAGKDIERSGEKIQGAASNAQQGASSSGSTSGSTSSDTSSSTGK
jgi:predicted small secreted protein